MIVKTPVIVKKAYHSLVWDMNNDNRRIYLTFDDGPHPDITPEVLNILKKYHAGGTFFSIGRNVERYPEVYDLILKEGHTTGNHTYSHLNGWDTKNREYYRDIRMARQLIPSRLFRPPYGRIKRSQLLHLRKFYKIIMWDVMPCDFDVMLSPDKCLENVILHARPGSIVVFHDSEKSKERMLYALPRVLEYFSEKGYTFSPITEDLLQK